MMIKYGVLQAKAHKLTNNEHNYEFQNLYKMLKHAEFTILLSTFCLYLFILAHCHVGLPVS